MSDLLISGKAEQEIYLWLINGVIDKKCVNTQKLSHV